MYVYMQTSLWLTDIRNMNMATNAPNHNINTLARREKKKGRKTKSCSERKGVNTSPCFFETLKYVRRLMCYSFKGIDNDINSNEIKMKTNGRERRRKSGQTFLRSWIAYVFIFNVRPFTLLLNHKNVLTLQVYLFDRKE